MLALQLAVQRPLRFSIETDDRLGQRADARRRRRSRNREARVPELTPQVLLDSANHILLEQEPAWTRFQEAVQDFTGAGAPAGEPSVFASLSSRERQVLTLIADGLSNTDIAERLAISEKTVRNHTSNLFDKLGVWSRAQAIVFARDRGFQ